MELELQPNARVESSSRPSTRCVLSVIDSLDGKIQITREDFPREMEGEKRINALLNRCSWSLVGGISSVPTKLYKQNKQAYTPQAVAIGPIHRCKALLCPMQLNKGQYLKRFFDRTTADKNLYYQKVKEWEGKARACYQDRIDLNSDKFVDMLLLDGIFIIEFYLRLCFPELRERDDDIFKKELWRDDIFHDMVVLENQLPFFVLEDLYKLADYRLSWEEFLSGIAKEHLRPISVVEISRVKETLETDKIIRHLADFVHAICVVTIPRKEPPGKEPPVVQKNCELSRSATELREAGVKFVLEETKLSYDLNFKEADGSLEFPALLIDRWTESFFRNFIALEHCLQKDMIMSSYIILMANLAKTPKDVDFLIECKIFCNMSLSDSEDVCALFKNLYSKSMMDKREFYYTHLCEHLNKYSKDSWHQWKAACFMWKEMLRRDYFSNPWSIISVIAAFVLLVLTAIQTVSSVIAVRWFG